MIFLYQYDELSTISPLVSKKKPIKPIPKKPKPIKSKSIKPKTIKPKPIKPIANL